MTVLAAAAVSRMARRVLPWGLTLLGVAGAVVCYLLWDRDAVRYARDLEQARATIAAQETSLEAFRRADAAAAADAADSAAADDVRIVIRERIVHAPPTDDAPAAPVLLDAVRSLWPPPAAAGDDGGDPANAAHLP